MIALTFDVDFTDYIAHEPLDEIEAAAPLILRVLAANPAIRTTWFVRIDSHIGEVFGSPDCIVRRHAAFFDRLRADGHEVGWHHHAYRMTPSGWTPETRAREVCEQLAAASEYARNHGMTACRMGWGYHCNDTMAELVRLGWVVDSSAVPRPQYEWDTTARDWSGTPNAPYRPSATDYRVPGEPSLPLLEVPITTVPLALAGDTRPDVLRNVSPSFHGPLFRRAMQLVPEDAVLICHPYELLPRTGAHRSLAFDGVTFSSNIEWLSTCGAACVTLAELSAAHVDAMPASASEP